MPFLSMILLHTSWQFLLQIWYFWTVQTEQFSYGCKINIMLTCFNWSKSHHLQNSFHTAHHPWPQKSSLAPALVFKSPGHSGPPLLPFVPPHLSICLSFQLLYILALDLPDWLTTCSFLDLHFYYVDSFSFCHVWPLFWYVYLVDWIISTKQWRFNKGNCIWSSDIHVIVTIT